MKKSFLLGLSLMENMKALSDLKNVGKATLEDLRLLNIQTVEELAK